MHFRLGGLLVGVWFSVSQKTSTTSVRYACLQLPAGPACGVAQGRDDKRDDVPAVVHRAAQRPAWGGQRLLPAGAHMKCLTEHGLLSAMRGLAGPVVMLGILQLHSSLAGTCSNCTCSLHPKFTAKPPAQVAAWWHVT